MTLLMNLIPMKIKTEKILNENILPQIQKHGLQHFGRTHDNDAGK